METRIDSEQMESLLYTCIVDKAPCNLGNNLNEIKDNEGRTLLHWATFLGLKEEVEYVLSLGADPNEKDDEGKTPLHDAAAGENVDIVMTLLNHGADVNIRDNKGRIPLHYTKKQEIAELLIKYGSNVNATDNEGNTPLHTVAPEAVETLLQHGADPNATNRWGLPPIYYVMQRGNCDVAMKLLRVTDENVIANVRDESGNSLLHIAVKSGCKEAVQQLTKYGINSKNSDGDTPLHDALFWDAGSEIIKLLIINGADVHLPNNAGITPLQLILSRCRKDYPCAEILSLILDHTTVDIETILRHAFNIEQQKLLKLLYSRGLLSQI
jgi:ankyrin repeat protein